MLFFSQFYTYIYKYNGLLAKKIVLWGGITLPKAKVV
jgi:hypothetical protein